MIRKLLLFLLFVSIQLPGWAQDPQFSQFYANPLYLNPALAGGAMAPRLTANYRNQWPALSANFVTTSIGIDTYMPRYNSGIGLYVLMDSQGLGNLKSTEVGAQYSYQLQLNEENFLRLGVQGAFATRTLDYFGLTFGDQYNNNGFTGNPTNEPIVQDGGIPQISYADFSTGAMLYSDWYWAGLAVHHINRPNQSFWKSGPTATPSTGVPVPDPRLPMKISFQGGMRIPFGGYTYLGNEIDREKTISPAIMYKKQGKFDQLDVGMYVTYAPLVFGTWYRGLPIKKYAENINNHESLIFLAGFRQDTFSIGYSYDATISTLGVGSGGAHEISLSYIFEPLESNKRTKRRSKALSCPKF